MRISTLIFEYRCSVCWGMLTERNGEAVCYKYGSDHAGYHRLSGIEWRQRNSENEKWEVWDNYAEIRPICWQLGLVPKQHPDSELQERLKRNNLALRGNGKYLD